MNDQRLQELISMVEYKPEYRFRTGRTDSDWWVQVATYDDMSIHGGRKWRISSFMTDSEVVQTLFMVVLAFEEHEVREYFTFAGERVFGPHLDVWDLHKLAQQNHYDLRASND